MHSTDERREVAARLRKTRRIMAFVDALGIDLDSDWCWADVSRRVADLIDPTCHNKYRNHYDRSFLCSKCGYEAFTYGDSDCDPYDFAFCPNCGAMVVRGGED